MQNCPQKGNGDLESFSSYKKSTKIKRLGLSKAIYWAERLIRKVNRQILHLARF